MRRSMTRLALAGLLGCAFTLQAHAQAQDSARLRFAWPSGLVAQVESNKTRMREVDGQPPARSVTSYSHVMRAARQGQQYTIAFSDLRLDPKGLAALPPPQQALMRVLTQAALPGYLVSADGDFVALDKPEAFQEAMRSALSPLLPDGPGKAASLAALDKLLGIEVLSAAVRGDWDWLVGSWAGGEQAINLGEDYVAQTQGVAPLINQPIAYETHFKVTRRLPCDREGRSLECIELKASTRPDSAALKQAVAGIVAQLAPEAAAGMEKTLSTLDLLVELELITEPDTLVPHRSRLTKTTVLPGLQGQPTNRQVEETVQTFRYEAGR